MDDKGLKVEPDYVADNGYIDSMAVAWLFYSDHVFFLENEIAWNGRAHSLTGIQLNAANLDEAPILRANSEQILGGVADLLGRLERDEGLHAPRSSVHPALHAAIREGDLTGITLFNLMACARALVVKQKEEGVYGALCDERLPRGVPGFYRLVARMVWDMRDYNDITGPFSITFVLSRNIDADQCFGQFEGVVEGAVSEGLHVERVDDCPDVFIGAGRDERSTPRGFVSAQELVDVMSAAYGTPARQLVVVLANVASQKRGQEYREALEKWEDAVGAAEREYEVAEAECSEAQALESELDESVRKIRAELEKAKSDEEPRAHDETLLAESKEAAIELAQVEKEWLEATELLRGLTRKFDGLQRDYDGLGTFAIAAKKELKGKMQLVQAEMALMNERVDLLDRRVRILVKSACRQAEIEKQIASYGDGQVADLERKVRDAELEVEQAADLLGQAQEARDACKARLDELRANRPRESA